MTEDQETRVDPSEFRQRLREDAAGDYDLIRGTLRKAMDAEKEISLRCDYCKKNTKVRVPDYGAMIRAAELYMNAGFGRPEPESKTEQEQARKPITPEEARKELEELHVEIVRILARGGCEDRRGRVSPLAGRVRV